MNKVFSLQKTNAQKPATSPNSIFSLASVAGYPWTTLMPYSSASYSLLLGM